MKFFFIIIEIFFCFPCFAKVTVMGTVKGNTSDEVMVYWPINNFAIQNILTNNSTHKIDSKHNFKILGDIDKPSFITFEIDAEVIWLFLEPGDIVNLHIDLTQIKHGYNQNWLYISGNNCMGHILFNKVNYYPAKKFKSIANIYAERRFSPLLAIDLTKKAINELLMPFRQLLNEKSVTQTFYNGIAKTFTANLLAEALKYLNYSSYDKNVLSYASILKVKALLFNLCNPLDSTLIGGLQTGFYIYHYFLSEALRHINGRKEDDLKDSIVQFSDNKYFLIPKTFVPFLYIHNRQLQENLWAWWHCNLSQLYGHALVDKEYEAFEFLFPGSRWLQAIKNNFHTDVNASDLKTVEILDSIGKLNSIDSLLNLLKKGRFYVDLWATWCVPCRQEFLPQNDVDSFMKKNEITRIFISLDNYTAKQLWLDIISKYNIGGKHILAGKALVQSIKSKVFNNKEIMIPRYLIVSYGKILEIDALRPSDKENLISQFIDLYELKGVSSSLNGK